MNKSLALILVTLTIISCSKGLEVSTISPELKQNIITQIQDYKSAMNNFDPEKSFPYLHPGIQAQVGPEKWKQLMKQAPVIGEYIFDSITIDSISDALSYNNIRYVQLDYSIKWKIQISDQDDTTLTDLFKKYSASFGPENVELVAEDKTLLLTKKNQKTIALNYGGPRWFFIERTSDIDQEKVPANILKRL